MGGIPETTALLAEPWDFILFTGSIRVGKIVAKAAAEHLTPCALELGGKNPVVVDENLESLEVAARRIAWGRTINAGQVCVAPEYVLVMESVASKLEAAIVRNLEQMFGADPSQSPDLGRIISPAGVRRIQAQLKEAQAAGKVRVVYGGQMDPEKRYVAPTVVRVADTDAALDCALMQEEAFAPVLSIVPVKSLDHAVELAARISGKHPLALYVFSSRRAFQEECLARIPSGGAGINDVIMQAASPTLPFGGCGTSGMGCYGGRDSFETFSHRRGVVKKLLSGVSVVGDPLLRYPPFSPTKYRIFRALMCQLPLIPPLVPLVKKLLWALAPVVMLVAGWVWAGRPTGA